MAMILEVVTDYEKKIFFTKKFSELRNFKKFSNLIFEKRHCATALFNSLNERTKKMLSYTNSRVGEGVGRG